MLHARSPSSATRKPRAEGVDRPVVVACGGGARRSRRAGSSRFSLARALRAGQVDPEGELGRVELRHRRRRRAARSRRSSGCTARAARGRSSPRIPGTGDVMARADRVARPQASERPRGAARRGGRGVHEQGIRGGDGRRHRRARRRDDRRGVRSLPAASSSSCSKRSGSPRSRPSRAAASRSPASRCPRSRPRWRAAWSGAPSGRRDLLLIDAIVLARRDPNVAESYRRVIRAHVDAFERTARGSASSRDASIRCFRSTSSARLVLSLAFGVMALRALEQAPPADATVARLVEQLLQPANERSKPEERVLARVQSRARAAERARGRPARADRAGRRRRAQPAQDRRGRRSVSRADPSHPRRSADCQNC